MTLKTDLSDKQRLAIDHLLSGETITATAEAVSVSRQTVHEWKRDPVFAHELATGQADRQALFQHKWEVLAEKVTQVVDEALSTDDMPTRLNAARLWLSHHSPTPKEPGADFDPVLARYRQVEQDLRRDVEREFTLGAFSRARAKTGRGLDRIVPEVQRRLLARPREDRAPVYWFGPPGVMRLLARPREDRARP